MIKHNKIGNAEVPDLLKAWPKRLIKMTIVFFLLVTFSTCFFKEKSVRVAVKEPQLQHFVVCFGPSGNVGVVNYSSLPPVKSKSHCYCGEGVLPGIVNYTWRREVYSWCPLPHQGNKTVSATGHINFTDCDTSGNCRGTWDSVVEKIDRRKIARNGTFEIGRMSPRRYHGAYANFDEGAELGRMEVNLH